MKNFLNKLFVEVTWIIAGLLLIFKKRNPSPDAVLLVPAADLNGGFGEDIMIASFITNFAKGRPVTILTGNRIARNDYEALFNNITFTGGFHRRANYIKILNIISKHSLVYVIGADIMDGTYKVSNSVNRLRLLDLAHALGIEAQISGFSVSKNISPEVKKKFTQVSEFMKLKSRDVESYKRMLQFLPVNKLVLTNDIAFICPDLPATYQNEEFSGYTKWAAGVRSKGKLIAAVCPNSIQANKMGLEQYRADFTTLLSYFLKNSNIAFVFLYHDIRPLCGNDTDSTISQYLSGFFEGKEDCFYTGKITNGNQLKGYLSAVDFTITGRMHLGISGITYNKPMFGVAYANKFEGMVKLFHVDPLICLADYDKMQEAEATVINFIRRIGDYKEKIANNIEQVQSESLKNYS